MFFTNKVKLAVEMAGGPTQVANEIKVSNTAVHAWIRNGKVSNINNAKRLAEMSGIAISEIRPC